MLTELRVRDLATIADVTLQLGPGLNVLTGETGRGQVHAGGRAGPAAGRAGRQRQRPARRRQGDRRGRVRGDRRAPPGARIEELGLDVEDGRVVVRREISAEGRSRAWVNGSPTTAAVLGELGALLVDLHGQHETQSLLHAEPSATSSTPSPTPRPSAPPWPRRTSPWPRSGPRRQPRGPARRGPPPGRLSAPRGRGDRWGQDQAGRGRGAAGRGPAAEPGRGAGGAGAADRRGPRRRGRQRARRARRWPTGRSTALEKADPARGGWREMLDAAYANLSELARLADRVRRRRCRRTRAAGRGRAAAGVLFRLTGSTAPRSRRCWPPATRPPRSWTCWTRRTPICALWPPGAPRRRRALRAAAEALSARRRRRPTGWPAASTACCPSSACRAGSCRVMLAPLAEPASHGAESGAARRPAQRGAGGQAAGAGGLGRRALPAHAGAQGGAGPARRDRDAWCSTRWIRGSAERSARRWARRWPRWPSGTRCW